TLTQYFEGIVETCPDEVLAYNVPERIRFGLARGTVYELAYQTSRKEKEYVGSCINLASRLQKYCPELDFLASAKLELTNSDLENNGYITVAATQIKGFLSDSEKLIVDEEEFEEL